MKRLVYRLVTGVFSVAPFSRVVCWRGSRSVPQVAITFDDGPDAAVTPRVLEILARENVRATFFLLGRAIEKCPGLLKEMSDAGHAIGIHGYDHRTTGIREQVEKCAAVLAQYGIAASLFRFPLGSMNLRDLLWVRKRGYTSVQWSFDAHDSMRAEGKWDDAPDYDAIRRGDIVLMHDDNEVCVDELPKLIQGLKGRGLNMVTVSELIGV